MTENSTEATNNYAKMEEIWNTLIPNFQDKIDVLKDDINRIYKRKIVKFDEVDLDYQKKAASLFAKYSSIPEVDLDRVSDKFEIRKDIFVGTAEAIGGFVKDIASFAASPITKKSEKVQKTICGIDALTKGEFEEWEKEELVNEIEKQKAIVHGIKDFFEDPGEVIESGLEKKFQDLSDEANVEGISYVANKEGTKIGIDIGVAIATDGLLSGEGVIGKAVVSGEAAAAETAGIEIGAATEEAVGKAVASGLDDVVESGVDDLNLKINIGQQNKHIPGTNNYKQELANGKLKSILSADSQQLLDNFAGTGQKIGINKERVDFGNVIGKYVNPETGESVDTTVGIIHYGKNGAHIVPARPK